MKIKQPILICLVLISVQCQAQTDNVKDPRKQISISVTAGRFGDDDGLGIEIGTPSVFADRFSLRMKANTVWLESFKAATGDWARYQSVSASIIYNVAKIERSLFYAELGTQMIFPDARFSSENHVPAWYFLTGLDLFARFRGHFKVSYFFAGGLMFSEAHAEKLEGDPTYANGFLFSNGLRLYF